jgi:hypothetical protein
MTNREDLTERYLAVAVTQVPVAQRDALRAELTERIADTVDAHRAVGATPADAEYATLTELGHPAKLAADYLDRPLQLIGPRYYLLWRKLMRLVVPLAAGVAAVGGAIGAAADGASAGRIIGEFWSTGVQVAWTTAGIITLVLAIMDRTVPAEDLDPSAGWSPEQLPGLPTLSARRIRRDQIGDIVWLTILGIIVTFGNRLAFVRIHEGETTRVLDTDTWAWLRWALLALIAAEIVLIIVSLAARRWTWSFAAVNAVLAAATVAVLVPVLSTGRLFDPAALAAAGWAEGPALLGPGGTVTNVFVVVVVLVCVYDAAKGFVRAARSARR